MRWPPPPRELADAIARLVRQRFNRDGFLAPIAFVFATKNPLTGQRIEPTILTYALVGAPSTFAAELRELARAVHAPMVAQAYEIRMIGALAEQAGRGYESLRDAPGAKDYVVVFVEEERSGRTLAWIAPVRLRGAPTVGAFEEVPVPRTPGWLTAILPLVS